jgi:predicted aspartyl protease
VIGTVNQRRQAFVRLTVRHPQRPAWQDFDAMVDTGCEVAVVLLSADIANLGFPFSHSQRIRLADGRIHLTHVYDAVIEWFGVPQPVKAYEIAAGISLLGTPLLASHTLIINYAKGTVEIL